jgi:hypothetical protein
MAFHSTAFKRLFFLTVLTGVFLSRSWGQAVDSPVRFVAPEAITTTLVDAPSLGGGGGGGNSSDQPKQWLKVEYHYEIKPAQTPYVDAVEFRVWIEGRDLYDLKATTADGLAVVLTGSETYINLTATHDGYGVFYVHPSTLARYATKLGATDFTESFNIHLEAYVDGKLMDYFNKKEDPAGLDWFKAPRAVPNLVYRKDQCCFIVSDPSRYPELKHPLQ